MRRRLTFLVAVTTATVILSFLVPLALLLRTLAADRAVSWAQLQAQSLAAYAAGSLDDVDQLQRSVGGLVGHQSYGTTSLILPSGQVIGTAVDLSAADVRTARNGTSFTRTTGEGATVYIATIAGEGTVVARVAVPSSVLHRGVARASTTIAALALALTVVSVVAADRLARRFTRPILQVVRAADEMRAGNLQTRVEVTGGTRELEDLGGALNRLAARIQELLAAERDAVADLSHRLRTPVTALRLDAEAVTDPDVGERLRDHVAQLERTVDAIVADARRPTRTPVARRCDVAAVVLERVTFWSALADDQMRSFRFAVPDRPLPARIDDHDVADVVDVLIDNAFAHTDEGTAIEIWVAPTADGDVAVTIEDAGPGLPSVDVVHRGASSAGSSGLGLDIVRRAALASGGRMELGRSALGGAQITVVFGRSDG